MHRMLTYTLKYRLFTGKMLTYTLKYRLFTAFTNFFHSVAILINIYKSS